MINLRLSFLLVALLIRVAVIGFVLSVGISHIMIGHNIAEDDYDAKAKDKLYYSENSNSQIHPVFTSIIHFLIAVIYGIAQIKQLVRCPESKKKGTEQTNANESPTSKGTCLNITKWMQWIRSYVASLGVWTHVLTQLFEVTVQLLSLIQYSEGM